MVAGMQRAPGAVGAVVMAMTPAVTAVGAVVFLRDRLSRWQVLAIVLAVTGVALVDVATPGTRGSGDDILPGSALVFAAVCCEATYTLVGKRLTANLDALSITTVAAVVSAVVFLPLLAVQGSAFDWSTPTVGQWIATLWWGAGTLGLGSWLWFRGMRRADPGTVAAFMAVMPVSALVLSYVLLGEPFRWIHGAGMALVLGGLYALVRGRVSVH
jgi:drug/metabolite transporter (DMT)-like permease